MYVSVPGLSESVRMYIILGFRPIAQNILLKIQIKIMQTKNLILRQIFEEQQQSMA